MSLPTFPLPSERGGWGSQQYGAKGRGAGGERYSQQKWAAGKRQKGVGQPGEDSTQRVSDKTKPLFEPSLLLSLHDVTTCRPSTFCFLRKGQGGYVVDRDRPLPCAMSYLTDVTVTNYNAARFAGGGLHLYI